MGILIKYDSLTNINPTDKIHILVLYLISEGNPYPGVRGAKGKKWKK